MSYTLGYTNSNIQKYIGVFNAVYNGPIDGNWYTKVGKVFNTQELIAVFPGIDGVNGLKPFDRTAGRQKQTPGDFKVTLTDTVYEDSTQYPIENYLADSIGMFENNVKDLAQKAIFHWNELSAAAILAGASTACQDGQNFFATAHPYGTSTATQSNKVTATDIPHLAVVNKNTPTAYEASLIVNDLVAYITTMRDKGGYPVNNTAREFTFVVGDFAKKAAFSAAVAAVNLVATNGSLTNPVLGLVADGYKFNVILDTTLTGDNIWLFRSDGSIPAILLHQAGDMNFTPLGPDSEYARTNLSVMFGVWVPRAYGYGRYQHAVQATLSNAS